MSTDSCAECARIIADSTAAVAPVGALPRGGESARRVRARAHRAYRRALRQWYAHRRREHNDAMLIPIGADIDFAPVEPGYATGLAVEVVSMYPRDIQTAEGPTHDGGTPAATTLTPAEVAMPTVRCRLVCTRIYERLGSEPWNDDPDESVFSVRRAKLHPVRARNDHDPYGFNHFFAATPGGEAQIPIADLETKTPMHVGDFLDLYLQRTEANGATPPTFTGYGVPLRVQSVTDHGERTRTVVLTTEHISGHRGEFWTLTLAIDNPEAHAHFTPRAWFIAAIYNIGRPPRAIKASDVGLPPQVAEHEP